MTMEDVRRIHEKHNGHFFDYENIRWFGSRIETECFPGGFFITSEHDERGSYFRGELIRAWNGERRYSIRQIDTQTGFIHTCGEYGGFRSLEDANAALNNILNKTINQA